MNPKALDTGLTEQILAAVAAGFDEQLAVTQQLIAYPSLRGIEATAQDFVYTLLAERGYVMDRWTIAVDEIGHHPGFSPVTIDYHQAVNVVGTWRPRQEQGRSLILNGHIDVVPEGPWTMWTHPPYQPHIDGDWLYGRGSGDMKAGLVANIFALDALRRLGYRPAARVHIQSVTEEECTGNGALACLVRGYHADAAIIPEPEDNRLVRANVGVIWFQVSVQGKPVHVREAGQGANAIEAAYRLIQALRGLETEWNRRKHAYPYFSELDHPINFNVGKIHGGDWASSVPAWCTFDARIAIYPGDDPQTMATEIEDCLRAASRDDAFLSNNPPQIDYNGFFAQGYVLEEGSEAEHTLAQAHQLSFADALQSFVTPSYLDGRVFVIYDGTPCLVYGPVAENIHGFDERVQISSVQRITGTLALFIAAWCGLEPVGHQ